jgi:hypothetical protein
MIGALNFNEGPKTFIVIYYDTLKAVRQRCCVNIFK